MKVVPEETTTVEPTPIDILPALVYAIPPDELEAVMVATPVGAVIICGVS